MKVAFRTLGCKVNQYETEAVRELFVRQGYEITRSLEDCDVYVVNTCTVTHMSDSKSRQTIRRIKKNNPDAVVCVVGCYSQVAPEEIEAIDNVDIIIGTKGRAQLPDLVRQFRLDGKRRVEIRDLEEDRAFDELTIHTEFENTRAYIKIQEGCDMYCSYCIIPYSRGHIASRRARAIEEEIQDLVKKGFKEVVLTGIHVASYGKDLGGAFGLMELIEQLSRISGLERIRLSSIEPRWVTEDRLERLSQIPAFCDHFHLSLQSGSDQILQSMNRKYDTTVYQERVDMIRRYFPHCGITTDVIVGFPGETEKAFQETLKFCQTIGFSRIHIFPYSPRRGTPAALFTGQINPEEKKNRVHRLEELEERLRYAFLDRELGHREEVLFEELSGDSTFMEGYTKNYNRVKMPRKDEWMNQVILCDLVRREGDLLVAQEVPSGESSHQ